MEWQREQYVISDQQERLDIALIHRFLREESYWAQNIPLSVLRRSIESSLCFGLYDGEQQIGFARVVTDYARFAYLADVFVLNEYRGAGLGVWLVQTILNHPQLRGIWRWMLVTRDAQELYRRVGFNEIKSPERYMELLLPESERARDLEDTQ